jgi:3'(2'), 5'-bisphosphate nucleotidase
VRTALAHELELASELARRGGEEVRRRFRDAGLAVERKHGGEPVTAADRASEALILDGLRRAFPEDGVLSEEQPDAATWAARPRAWVVDPLDGTSDFVAGRPGFAVMIGLLEGGRPVLGVVREPLAGVTYSAARGAGAFALADGEPAPRRLAVSAAAELAALRLVASRSHRSPRLDEVKRALGISDELGLGSVGLKVALIARGERDLYLNLDAHSSLWDACAPEAILAEAGGRITDLDGAPLRYAPDAIRLARGIVASNCKCHAAVLRAIAPLLSRGSARID